MPDDTKKITYPVLRDEILKGVQKQLETGNWTRLEGCPEFEADWKNYQSTDSTVWFVSSGTSALQAIMLGYGIGYLDEVITTPYTWGATVSAILSIGAIPIFADIDYSTGQIDPESVKKLISSKTKAILTVHLFGTPSPADNLRKIADDNGIPLLEDASQAHGARLNNKNVGNFGHAAAFSCMGLKPLGGTEGGIAQFEDPAVAERAFLYGKHPRGLSPQRVEALQKEDLLDTLQFGWRPCAISAAILQARLPFLDEENEGRRKNARLLRELLQNVAGISLPDEPEGSAPVYHLLSFIIDDDIVETRFEKFLEKAREHALPVFRYIPKPIHRMKRLNAHGYKGPPVVWHANLFAHGVDYRESKCPMAEKRSRSTVESAWNNIEYAPQAMESLAEKFAQVLKEI